MKHLFLTSSIGTPGIAESIRTKLGNEKKLKTAFITTPVEPPEEQLDLSWLEEDRQALRKSGFDTFDYTVTGKNASDFARDLADIDAIYVSGGNTRHLLKESQLSGFIPFVRDFVNAGNLYISTSAGSIITGPELPPYLWGEEQAVPNLTNFKAYNFVDFTLIPHWGSTIFKDLYLGGRMEQVYSQSIQPFVLCNDYEYVEVVDNKYRIIDVRNEK